MLRNVILWVLIIVFLAGIAAIYGGIGWVIAWILDAGLDVNVNYSVFVLVGIGLFILTVIPYIAIRMYAKKKLNEFDAEIAKFNKSFDKW